MTNKIFTLADYPEIRRRGVELHSRIFKVLSKDDMKTCGRHLGIWHQKTLILDSDIEMDLFTDYAIYAYRPHGFNMAEKYFRLYNNKEGDFEQAMLACMRFARYSVFQIAETNRKDTLKVVDLFNQSIYKLVDYQLARTAHKAMVLAGHLIDLGGFSIQSGASVLFTPEIKASEEVVRVIDKLDDRQLAAFLDEPANGAKLARAIVSATIRLGQTANIAYTSV